MLDVLEKPKALYISLLGFPYQNTTDWVALRTEINFFIIMECEVQDIDVSRTGFSWDLSNLQTAISYVLAPPWCLLLFNKDASHFGLRLHPCDLT